MRGLEEEFSRQVVTQNLDATTPEAKKDIKSLGFKHHGLVVRSPDGKVLWTQADHTVKVDEVRGKLSELLADSS